MLNLKDLTHILSSHGIPAFRAKQILFAVCKEGAQDYAQISTLSEPLKEKLKQLIPILSIEEIRLLVSRDQCTQKALFTLKDNQKIEAVLMKFEDGRTSVCVSSQAGCQLGCKFCATGTMKFGRNLTYEEIADQVLYFAQKIHKEGQHISNIVFMGMGEPFMNYDAVIQSIETINAKEGLNIGARNITISTSGICEGIEKLAKEKLQVNLAVSLHAPNQELRAKIMPIARKYHLDQLMKAIHEYIQVTHRRVSYEYVMLKNINDSEKEAGELAALLQGQLCHVNLIPYNATDIENIEGSTSSNIQKFRNILKEQGIPVTIRVTLGQDIQAACGQLANKAEKVQKNIL